MAAVPPVEALLLAAVLGAEEDDITSFSLWLQHSKIGAHSPAWFSLASQTRPAAYAAHLSATIRADVDNFHHFAETDRHPRRTIADKVGSSLRVTPESFPALIVPVRQKPVGRARLCAEPHPILGCSIRCPRETYRPPLPLPKAGDRFVLL